MFRKATIAILTLAGFATLAAQTKPNFSGNWTLNVSKSDFGMLPPTESRTDVIEHNDPALKVSTTATGAQGKQSFTANYTTDGKEVVNKRGPSDMKSTAAWEGNKLVMNSKLTIGDNDVSLKAVWSLSDDGKTLTQNVHLAAAMGETDQKLVFEKGGEATATAAAAPAKAPTPSAGGAKSDYSGTWKLNVAKSDFGVLPGVDSRTDVIDHKDPTIKVHTVQDSAQGKQDYILSLSTDGKENTNNPGGLELKSTANWEGANLVVNTKLKFQDNDVTIKATWQLSGDGKVLTQLSHLASPIGETDQTFVFERQ